MIFANVCTRAMKQILGAFGSRIHLVTCFGFIADCILIGFERSSLAFTAGPLRDRDLDEYVVCADIFGEYGIAHPVSGVQI